MDNLTAGNPLAHRVRVYYDGSSTIAEGMPVCYNYLTTDNWYGGSVSDEGVVTASTTTAEGSHNKGKYLYVSNPICCNSTAADSVAGSNVITEDGNECDNLQVNMMVSIASATDSAFDGNYKITAINTTTNAVTLEMTAAQKALVTTQTDVTFKIDNIHAFAGVIAKGGWVGKTGPQVVDIYVPNGAIVPVKTVLAATVVGRTILSVVSATQTLGNPTTDAPDFENESDVDTAGQIDSKPVAIAAETITSAGLVLARLDDRLFMHQGGQLDHKFEVGVGAVNTTVNKMFLNFNITAGHCQALHYRSVLSGTGGDGQRGVYRFETVVRGVPADNKHVFGVNCHLELAAGTAEGGQMAALLITLRTKNVDPDLRGVGKLSAIQIEWILRKDTGSELTNPPIDGGHMSQLIYINSDSTGTQPDFFFLSEHAATVAQGTDAKTSATCAKTMKVSIANIDYYIPTYTLAELTT